MYGEPYRHTARPCYPMGLGGGRLWVQANGLFHTSPGQRLGFIARFSVAGQRPASFQMRMNRAFSAPGGFWGHDPRALPWAGMNDAFGVSIGRLWSLKCAHKTASFWPEELCLAPATDLSSSLRLHRFRTGASFQPAEASKALPGKTFLRRRNSH